MAWDLLRGRKFQSQIFGAECRNFRDWFQTVRVEFRTVFGHFELNFRDCFQTIWTRFSELFSASVGRSSGLVLISRLMSSGFVVCLCVLLPQ